MKVVQTDVTNKTSINAALVEIGNKIKALDILINNAGVSGIYFDNEGYMIPQTAINTDIKVYQKVYDTNVYGPARVVKAFIDLLKKSSERRIVNLSSSQGLLILHSDPNYLLLCKGSDLLILKSSFKYVHR